MKIVFFFNLYRPRVYMGRCLVARTGASNSKETKVTIRPLHTAAILSRETKQALFYHAEPRSQNRGGEAKRGKTKLFWSPGTIWPPCDKGEFRAIDKGTSFPGSQGPLSDPREEERGPWGQGCVKTSTVTKYDVVSLAKESTGILRNCKQIMCIDSKRGNCTQGRHNLS